MADYGTVQAVQVGGANPGFALVDTSLPGDIFLATNDTVDVAFPATDPTLTGNLTTNARIHAAVPATLSGQISTIATDNTAGGASVQYDDPERVVKFRYLYGGSGRYVTAFQVIEFSLIDQLGGEGYTGEADLESNTDWIVNGAYSPTPRNLFGVANETWLAAGADRSFTRRFGLPINNPSNEVEISGAMYIPDVLNVGATNASQGFMSLYLSSTSGQRIRLLSAADQVAGDNNALRLDIEGGPNGATPSGQFSVPVDDVRVNPGGLYYITFRVRGQTSSTNFDGRVEAYINGLQVYAEGGYRFSDWDWSSGGANEIFCEWYTTQLNTDRAEWRNLSIHQGWTSEDNVAPAFKYVADTTTLSVVNRGGFVDETATATDAAVLAAVTDNDDTTYATSATSDDSLTLGVDLPAGLPAGATVSDVIVRARVGKSGTGFNQGQLQVLGDATVQATQLFTTAAVEPSREVQTLRASDLSVTQGTLQVRVTNDVGGS